MAVLAYELSNKLTNKSVGRKPVSIETIIKVSKPKLIKSKSRNKEKLITDLGSKVEKQLLKVKDGSKIICLTTILVITSESSLKRH